jgi:uncharacterized membrane protein YheB (UPF0754 family)
VAPDRRALDALTRLLTSDLTGATVEELADLVRQVDEAEIAAKGRAIQQMRDAGTSWRRIGTMIGKPQSTLRFWHKKYLESQTL